MNRKFVVFFLLFLVGTCEMQTISASNAMGLIDKKPSVLSRESVSLASKSIWSAYANLKTSFDKNGNLDKITEAIVPGLKKLHGDVTNQELIQSSSSSPSVDIVLTSQRVCLVASFFLLVASVMKNVEFEKLFSHNHGDVSFPQHIREQVSNFLFLIAFALFFEGFMYMTDFAIQSNNDLRSLIPLIMKMLAAAFLTIEPMITILKFVTHKETSLGLRWPNFFGMMILHLSNMMDLSFQLQNFSASFSMSSLFSSNRQQWTMLFWTLGSAFWFASNPMVKEQVKLGSKSHIYEYLGECLLILGSSIFLFPTV